jgi:hypothetical protein
MKNYLRGRLRASLQENVAWSKVGDGGEVVGAGGSPVRMRESEKREREERVREEREREKMLAWLKLPTSCANRFGLT